MAETKSKRVRTPNPAPTEVVRDNTFSRAVVDKTIVLDLGRDVEIACLQASPAVANLRTTGKLEEIDVLPELTEVTRLRLPWASAVNLAMNILQPAIAKDMIDIEGFIKAVEDMSGKAKSASKKDVGSSAN